MSILGRGVGAKHVERVAGQSTGTATILVDKSGDNFILIVKGANGDLTPEDVERAGDDLKTCDLILLQLEVPLETVYAAIAFGKRHSVKTVLNPAPAVRELDMARARDASFLMPNETELAILTSMPVESEAEVAAAAQSLIGQGFEAVVVTLGARGALVAAREGVRRVAPVKVRHRHARRRRLHRQLRPLLRRWPRPRRRPRPSDPLRSQFGHQARRAEILCDRKRIRGLLRAARDTSKRRVRRALAAQRPLCIFARAMVD